jgi:hypothetical protein
MNIDKIFCMAFTKKITWETKENLLTCHSSLFKQERQGDSQCVITNRLAYQQAYAIDEKGKEVANVYHHGPTRANFVFYQSAHLFMFWL